MSNSARTTPRPVLDHKHRYSLLRDFFASILGQDTSMSLALEWLSDYDQEEQSLKFKVRNLFSDIVTYEIFVEFTSLFMIGVDTTKCKMQVCRDSNIFFCYSHSCFPCKL